MEGKKETVNKAKQARHDFTKAMHEALTPIRHEIDRRVKESGMTQAAYCKIIGVRPQAYARLTAETDVIMGPIIAQFASQFGTLEVSVVFKPYADLEVAASVVIQETESVAS